MKDIDDIAVEIAAGLVTHKEMVNMIGNNNHVLAEKAYEIAEALIEESKRHKSIFSESKTKKITKLPSMARCIKTGYVKYLTLDSLYSVYGYYKDIDSWDDNHRGVFEIEEADRILILDDNGQLLYAPIHWFEF
jgi:hypothetical protein